MADDPLAPILAALDKAEAQLVYSRGHLEAVIAGGPSVAYLKRVIKAMYRAEASLYDGRKALIALVAEREKGK